MEITVNKPVKDVWARIGKYCDITEWLQLPGTCTMISGKEGEVGSVRSVGAEILVAKTEYSYAYTQPVREGRLYNLYHGNLEARAIDAKTTKILYTLVYDLSVAGDDAAKTADVERRRTNFMPRHEQHENPCARAARCRRRPRPLRRLRRRCATSSLQLALAARRGRFCAYCAFAMRSFSVRSKSLSSFSINVPSAAGSTNGA
jgi:hypothetical protein